MKHAKCNWAHAATMALSLKTTSTNMAVPIACGNFVHFTTALMTCHPASGTQKQRVTGSGSAGQAHAAPTLALVLYAFIQIYRGEINVDSGRRRGNNPREHGR